MTADELLAEMKREFQRRKSVPGLLVAMIRFLRELGAIGRKFADFEEFAKAFPVQVTGARSGRAVVLTVSRGDTTLSLRPFYNDIERFFRQEQKRFDYPNMAPHATQAWSEYSRWLEAILKLTKTEASRVEAETIAFVLEQLPSHEIDSDHLIPPSRRFSELLTAFDFTAQKGEPRGGAFQGVVYAYLRADAPHLHLDIAKVGAGSRRLQRVGDIDGWQGERLILSAEVKHQRISDNQLADFTPFLGDVRRRHGLAMIVAESYEENARRALVDQGVLAVDLDRLVQLVEIWDPLKQDAAVDAFSYYVCHIEKRMPLILRLRSFLDHLKS
jgi:hypothetical protein